VLAIDLDGTLTSVDTLYESVLRLLFVKPFLVLFFPFWLLAGKAAFKAKISSMIPFNPEYIPYNTDLIEWIRHEKAQNREIVLCTASDISVAKAVSDHLGIFDHIIGSDGKVNNSGLDKRAILDSRFGVRGYDYAGNSIHDVDVWAGSNKAIFVAVSQKVESKALQVCHVVKRFKRPPVTLSSWRKFFRIEQWIKNLLLFVPIIAAHEFLNLDALVPLIPAFLSFSLCASAGYILNDLSDLESDRRHPHKCNRPLAAGVIPVKHALILLTLCLAFGFLIGSVVGSLFVWCLSTYFVSTVLYSFVFKRYALLDCIFLAGLYALRIIGGGVATNIKPSFWLLAFSSFMFLSLAFQKRYAEINVHISNKNDQVSGRGYSLADAPVLQIMGISAGYASVFLLSLYLNSDKIKSLYNQPYLIWLAVPILLLWISRLWLKAHRGEIYEDPVVFALQDRGSLLLMLFTVIVFLIAAL